VTTTSNSSILRRLQVVVWLQWMGATLGLPLLPLFLKNHGAQPSTIGVIMGSFFLSGVVTQFVAGRLADRFGRRTILIGALVLYGIAGPTYLLPVNANWFIITRILQGAAAGAIEVAALSTVAGLVPEHERGRAMSKIFAAQLGGIAMGPLFGVLIDVPQIGWAYTFAGLASVTAAMFARRFLPYVEREHHDEPLPPMQLTRQVVGAVVGSMAIGLGVGVYEASWSLLMEGIGATTTQIRLSWTFFCLPWVLLSSVGGKIADRFDRRKVAIFGAYNAAFFLFLYPHIHNPWILVAIGPCEAVGAALTAPALSSLLTQSAHDRELGRRQGLSTTFNTAALATSASLAGPLFAVKPSLPFTVFASASAMFTTSLFYFWRHVPGRIHESSEV